MTHRISLSTIGLATVLSAFGFTVSASAQHRPTAGAHVPTRDDAGRISLDGRLGRRDATDAEGRHRREQVVSLRRGDRVRFGVSSEAMDVMAVVEGPGGQRWEDDDGAGGTDARLVFTAPRDGSYRFIVTTYEAGETGSYQAEARVSHGGSAAAIEDDEQGDDEQGDDEQGSDEQGDEQAAQEEEQGDEAVDPAESATGAGTTYGIFVGISHYGGDNADLAGSAADAVQLARTFQQAGWMRRSNAVVLTDAEATAGGVRQAFQTLSQRVRPNDTLVFFFDGHGNRRELDLVGPDITRSELGQMMNRVQGQQLLVLDSCEAGGFATLVQGRSNRAGLFSSRATESSSTAPEVGAGGWLAYSFREAVGGGVRRRPDGSVALGDVITYVRRQYAEHRVTPEQNLVAVADRSQPFALGGRGDAVVPTATDTAVASRDPWRRPARRPGDVATAPAWPSMQPMPSAPSAAPANEGLFGNNDAFAQLLGAGVGVAGQVIGAMVK